MSRTNRFVALSCFLSVSVLSGSVYAGVGWGESPPFTVDNPGGGPELRWRPVAASGNVYCTPGVGPCGDAEIMLSEGGVQVILFLEMRRWDPDLDGMPLLGVYTGAIDFDSFVAGSPSNPDTLPGHDLVPVGYPDQVCYEGAFQALRICCSDLADPVGTADWLSNCHYDAGASCPPPPGGCIDRPDYVLSQDLAGVGCATDYYMWYAATTDDCPADPDGVSWFYGGTLLLDVPTGAEGTYYVRFIDDLNYTGVFTCAGPPISGLNSRAGRITFPELEPCCLPDRTCHDLTPEECVAYGGTAVSMCLGDGSDPDEMCEADCDGDGTPDINEADPLEKDCDVDGLCNGCELNCGPGGGACDLPGCGGAVDCNTNGVPDECDIGDGSSADCNGNTIPDECEMLPDCNNNEILDVCDISSGTSIDCNNNTVPDECDLADETSKDCNENQVPDLCDVATGFSTDCNQNTSPDECDIADGSSDDCQHTGQPGHGIPDSCDVDPTDPDGDGRTSEDCTGNGVPDECEPDCQPNGTADVCEIDAGAPDCTNNGIPDECEPDCQPVGEPGHGTADSCDIKDGISVDNNANDVPDECDPGACCYIFDPYYMCVEVTAKVCLDDWGAYSSTFLGIDTECPTEGVSSAEHQGTVVVHVTDPAQECGGGGGGRQADCTPGDPIDPWMTAEDAVMCHRFGVGIASPAIPAGFFGVGSDPFGSPAIQAICLEGEPLGPTPFGEFGDADTLILRTGGSGGTGDPFDRCDLPSATSSTVDTEVVALNLRSTAPITVTYGIGTTCEGQSPPDACITVWCANNPTLCEQWDVAVDLSSITPEAGWVTAVKTHCNGGTYNSELHVLPRFTFTRVAGGGTEVLDTGVEGIPYVALTQDDNPPWTSDVDETLGLPSGICTDFHPGIVDAGQVTGCDCNTNGIRDKCDIEDPTPYSEDCNGNGVPDECDLSSEISPDCNGNSAPDECDISTGASQDCNTNAVPDDCDISSGSSSDCNSNAVPDRCDIAHCLDEDSSCQDCNNNRIPDGCDVTSGASRDCTGNGVPDECDLARGASLDCNTNTTPDACDVADGSSADCNSNSTPDECDIAADPTLDCNVNGAIDECDLAGCEGDPACDDCQPNGILDQCDIAAASQDVDNNGIPDECLPPVFPPDYAASPHDAPKNRYVSFDTSLNSGSSVAYEVSLVSMKRCGGLPNRACTGDEDCEAAVPGSGTCIEHSDVETAGPWWVQAPQQEPLGCIPGPCGDEDWFARLDGTPYFDTWTLETLHLGDCEIIPIAEYEIRACLPPDGVVCSDPLTIATIRQPFIAPGFRGNYGDVAGPVDAITEQFTPPDGFTNVVDVSAYVNTKQNYGTANKPQTHPTWVDLHGLGDGNPPNYILNVSDVQQIMKAFVGDAWTDDPGNMNPGECP